jgi:hypothetical protein
MDNVSNYLDREGGAEAEPNHDWRLTLYSSHGTTTFQRYDKDAWRQIGL